jgi:hypothetical protein
MAKKTAATVESTEPEADAIVENDIAVTEDQGTEATTEGTTEDAKAKRVKKARILLTPVDDLPESDAATGRASSKFAEAFEDIKAATEAGDVTGWVAVQEYGNSSGARTQITYIEKNKPEYAEGFELAERKFNRDGSKERYSVLYAKYVGADA